VPEVGGIQGESSITFDHTSAGARAAVFQRGALPFDRVGDGRA
jgi:hypothetical protein